MIRRWWQSIHTDSRESKLRELLAIESEIEYLEAECERLYARRDVMMVDLGSKLKLVQP